MREILFRAKRLDTGEWVEGYLVKRPSAIQMPGYGGPWYISVQPQNPDDNGGFYNVDPKTVGQYTGMRDRKDRYIFEDDIIREGQLTLIVKWQRTRWAPLNKYGKPASWMIAGMGEIIGNSHDNPELLRGQ